MTKDGRHGNPAADRTIISASGLSPRLLHSAVAEIPPVGDSVKRKGLLAVFAVADDDAAAPAPVTCYASSGLHDLGAVMSAAELLQ
jgi:hypothetical protein